MRRVCHNPYAGVDWANDRRYKASLHVHTTESDGRSRPAAVVDAYHACGYDILAITDHDRHTNGHAATWPWSSFGRDPDQLGMLAVKGNELSMAHHVGTYLHDLWRDDDPWDDRNTDIEWMLDQVQRRGGIAQMAHPGRHEGRAQWYVDLHRRFARLVGIEVYNNGDRYPQDRKLWDRMWSMARAQDLTLPMWGWSVDDMHYAWKSLGRNYHLHLMPRLDEASFRESLTAGAFVAIYDPFGVDMARHVPHGTTPAPIIDRLAVDEATIALTVRQTHTVVWISEGRAVSRGPVLNLDHPELGRSVRAQLVGSGGAVTLTQPFSLASLDSLGTQEAGRKELL